MQQLIEQAVLDRNTDFQKKVQQMPTQELDIFIENLFAYIDHLPKKRYRSTYEEEMFKKAQIALNILIAQGLLRVEKLINSITI